MHGPWNIHPDCQESGAGEAAPHVRKWRAATWFASWIPRLTNGESESRPWIIHWWLGKSQKKPLWCLHVKCARLPEHLHAPSGHSGEEARSEVPRRVDGVAAVQTHGHGDGHDDQADAQWLHAFGSADVLPVSDGQDAQDEGAGADHLREETSIKTWWKDLLVCLFCFWFVVGRCCFLRMSPLLQPWPLPSFVVSKLITGLPLSPGFRQHHYLCRHERFVGVFVT